MDGKGSIFSWGLNEENRLAILGSPETQNGAVKCSMLSRVEQRRAIAKMTWLPFQKG